MKLEIVAVRDSAMEAFNRPIFVPAIAAAVRSIQDETNRRESEIFKHPGDYSLFHLGSFDDATGQFTQFEKPVHLVNCAQLQDMEIK